MVRDGSEISGDSPPAMLHELRKRGKELRYPLEMFGGLFATTVVKPMVSSLKDHPKAAGVSSFVTSSRGRPTGRAGRRRANERARRLPCLSSKTDASCGAVAFSSNRPRQR
jgi:hypothetical protein